MKKLAILGASYLQVPLIKKANSMGIETHVFAWQEGAVGKDFASVFYPISILEKDSILEYCEVIGINGITSIASDIAMPTVNYVAHLMGLVGNSLECTLLSTDKYEMRRALSKTNIRCPRFARYTEPNFRNREHMQFPLIVKPTDRSGSRGVTKVHNTDQTNHAIQRALTESLNKSVVVEEFIEGREFSVEAVTYAGEHRILAITDKVTTGAPFFVELAHHQPADVDTTLKNNISSLTIDALDAIGLSNGFSHTEVLLDASSKLYIVEVAGRMGGDFIGSTLTAISTGVDTLRAVVDIALNRKPDLTVVNQPMCSGILFLSLATRYLNKFLEQPDSRIIDRAIFQNQKEELTSSNDRFGYFIYKSEKREFLHEN